MNLSDALAVVLQIILIDLLLSGDNALVIAVVCRSLPDHQKWLATLLGVICAIVLRLLLTVGAHWLLYLPLIKLLGACWLWYIALSLLQNHPQAHFAQEQPSLVKAVTVILLSDLSLSLDNALALAAATNGHMLLLLLGMLISVPILIYGSVWLVRMIDQRPQLILVASALLGGLAGQLAVDDALYAGWLSIQSPALQWVVPVLGAVFVLIEHRIVQIQKQRYPHLNTPMIKVSPALSAVSQPTNCQLPVASAHDALSMSWHKWLTCVVYGAVLLAILILLWLALHVLMQGLLPLPMHPGGVRH